jgi:hypothetical protein
LVKIFSEWFPSSGYKQAGTPELVEEIDENLQDEEGGTWPSTGRKLTGPTLIQWQVPHDDHKFIWGTPNKKNDHLRRWYCYVLW